MDWKSIIENNLKNGKNKVVNIDIRNKSINYTNEIKSSRDLKILTGDEEIVRAFLIDKLVNQLDYNVNYIELEKMYTIRGGHSKINPRIDVLVKDKNNAPFFFIEVKAPNKFEEDKKDIEGQLFSLAQAEERDNNVKVKYLVYYTIDEVDGKIADRAIVIDFEKYKTYSSWENDGFISLSTELTAGYGEPKKQPLIKGDENYDLRLRINRNDIENLGTNLHNVLWGGGGTNDSEIFYSLVNIILAKIQDEYEKEDGQEYDFQVYQYGDNPESSEKVFSRVNSLYKRALKEQLNVTDEQKIEQDSVINRNKFQMNNFVYTVQALENISFLEGRSSLDGKDILGDFFESITRDGFKQDKGQFFTPTVIVKFLLYGIQLDKLGIDRLNENRELPLIMDPSAGSGTYLVEAMKLLTQEIKYKQRSMIKTSKQTNKRFEELFMPDDNENKWAREYLYGSEINFDLGTASKVNMILHGDGSTNIFVQSGLLPFRLYRSENSPNYLENSLIDELYEEKEINGNFDLVVSNPPFSIKLDTVTQKEIENTFVFGDKKNSENLFIERYYQLLKENGRLGVVLPESVFDTLENKYIRIFIFKYFNVKAIVSLPQVTFEPYTSTKTSLLFAQKKTVNQIRIWNELWNKYGKEWARLKVRINAYQEYFVDNKSINRKWAKDVLKDIENNDKRNIRSNIYRFLKDYDVTEDNNIEIKDLLNLYNDEIKEVTKIEKDAKIFGYYNVWWVFSEVSKHLNSDVLMMEADNVGYKRSKKGTEKKMPNDLYDIEYAPKFLNKDNVLADYEENIDSLESVLKENQQLYENMIKTNKESASIRKKIENVSKTIGNLEKELDELKAEKEKVQEIIAQYYIDDVLKDEYIDRIDVELINHFKSGVLINYRSDDVLLREKSKVKLLDVLRQEIDWK